VERYDENSRFSGGQHELLPCPMDLDLVNGSSFVVNIDHFNSEATSCSCGSGSAIEGPDGWVWNPSNEVGACQGSFFQGGAQATRDTCHARIRLFIDTKQLPSGSSVVGQAPVAWAQRDFYAGYADGGTTTCPVDGPSCSDHFVVEITNQ
jgi:hypothetical protein